MPRIRVLHISFFDELGTGHARQLTAEHNSSKRLDDVAWETRAVTRQTVGHPWASRVPWLFRFPQGGKLYFWREIARVSKDYDAVLVRHTMPDPWAPLFAPSIPNLFTVHHSKEIEEIRVLTRGPKRALVTWWERRVIPLAYRRARGVIGVTSEIGEYERRRFRQPRPAIVYPNAFEMTGAGAEDHRNQEKVSAVFVASTFDAWHGLDRLLEEIETSAASSKRLTLHLVGNVSADLEGRIAHQTTRRAPSVDIVLHGSLDSEGIRRLCASAHVAIASLALDRKGLTEATTLKVREYLAAGVPVYSTHVDAGLPPEFPYYRIDGEVSLGGIIAFAQSMSQATRLDVIQASHPYIDKQKTMIKLADSVSEVLQLRRPQ